MNNATFLPDAGDREPVLLYNRIIFANPEILRLQREVALHRWLLWALSVAFASHMVWGHFP